MNLSEAYRHTSERYLAAALQAIASSLQEVSVFAAYHSFECIGGALSEYLGQRYPRSPHSRKIDQFTRLAKGYKFALPVAHLA